MTTPVDKLTRLVGEAFDAGAWVGGETYMGWQHGYSEEVAKLTEAIRRHIEENP